MNRKILAFFSLLVILVFIGYIIYDTATGRSEMPGGSEEIISEATVLPEHWIQYQELLCNDGDLTSVAVSDNGTVYLGGDSFLSCYDQDLSKKWTINTSERISSLSVSGDTIFGTTKNIIKLYDPEGKMIDEWGPFDDDGIITSITSNKTSVVFADAGNRLVFVLAKDGRMKSMIGQSGEKFVIPSPYFDVAINKENTIFIANTGKRRIETRTAEGIMKGYFGSPGTAPGSFCGCCNPAHFVTVPQGYITAEKGLNRIKILDQKGEFVEWVSANNNFMASIPLDIASSDGITIYAANPADSKLIVFKRKI